MESIACVPDLGLQFNLAYSSSLIDSHCLRYMLLSFTRCFPQLKLWCCAYPCIICEHGRPESIVQSGRINLTCRPCSSLQAHDPRPICSNRPADPLTLACASQSRKPVMRCAPISPRRDGSRRLLSPLILGSSLDPAVFLYPEVKSGPAAVSSFKWGQVGALIDQWSPSGL